MLVAAIAALSACSKQEAPPTADATSEAAATDAAAAATSATAADGKSAAGTYKVTSSDGKVFTEVDKPDGSYETTQDGKVVETGKWVQRSPAQFCFTKDEPNPKERCTSEKVDEKGVWTSVNPEGKTSTVVRVEG